MEKFKELLALMVYTQYISQSSINKKQKPKKIKQKESSK